MAARAAALQQAGAGVDEVEAALRQAIAAAQRQHAKSLELRAAMDLARVRHQQGRGAEARAELARVYDWFTEGRDTADLTEARALLADLAAASRTPAQKD
jgi:predicted ATPase